MFKGEQLHHNGIFLHAWRYQALPREGEEKGWAYEAPLPPWARGFQAGGDRGRTGV